MKATALLVLISCAKPSAPPPKPLLDPTDVPANVDAIVADVLATTGVPSASVAVMRDGKLMYVHAYGNARLTPRTPAAATMRYSVGSISKQFTAAAILLLAEQGKLSLDDAVGKYIPGLTRGDEVTIRELLSHTSGYQDYAPQDYMIPAWTKPVKVDAIVDGWARRPLDFEPGTQWQYSNTNYVIAGLICEKASGSTLPQFLADNFYKRLGMTTVTDAPKLGAADAQGYFRRARGPLLVAEPVAQGWLYAAGDLSMTVTDLATWDLALMNGALLSPSSMHIMETEVVLPNGGGTTYGLGLQVNLKDGNRELRHSGEVIGFVADNLVLPDDKIAVAVLTNEDASSAATLIADRVRAVVLKSLSTPNAAADQRIRYALDGFTKGTIDRTRFTPNASSYFTPGALDDYRKALAGLGPLKTIEQSKTGKRGGFTYRIYTATFRDRALDIDVYETEDGTIEQFLLSLPSS